MSQAIIKSELAGLLVLLLSFAVPAKAETLSENPVELPSSLSGELPGMEHLAASLSHDASRLDALLTMIVVNHLLEDPAVSGQLEAHWQDERAWLDQLAARFPNLPVRSSAMDPAAWFVLLELDQYQITPSSLVSPQGPDTTVLIRQLFDRSDERLAAALLPEVLMRMESRSTRTWQDLLSRAVGDEHWQALVVRIDAGLSGPSMVEALSPAGEEESSDPIRQALESFQVLAASVMYAGAPDTLRLQQLRYMLLLAIPELDDTRTREAAQLLRLATAVDGLYENKFLAFAETLLWVVMEMILAEHTLVATAPTSESGTDSNSDADSDSISDHHPETKPETNTEAVETAQYVVVDAELPRVLVELLPQLSSAFARGFSDTDPRINAILAAAFDIVQNL